MPLVLTKDVEFEWLNKNLTKNEIEEFLVPPGQQHFEAYPVKPFNLNQKIQENITEPMRPEVSKISCKKKELQK